jgi:DNA-binding protein H-NS
MHAATGTTREHATAMANLQDLLARKQKLDQQIALMQSEARTEAIAKIPQLMRDYGLKPKWHAAALAQGKTLEDVAV